MYIHLQHCRSARTGLLPLLEVPAPSPSKSSASTASSSGYATDVFGSVVQTSSGVPALKKQPECTCPNCQRNMAASRYVFVILSSVLMIYRVTIQVSDLGWVDSDLACSLQ